MCGYQGVKQKSLTPKMNETQFVVSSNNLKGKKYFCCCCCFFFSFFWAGDYISPGYIKELSTKHLLFDICIFHFLSLSKTSLRLSLMSDPTLKCVVGNTDFCFCFLKFNFSDCSQLDSGLMAGNMVSFTIST